MRVRLIAAVAGLALLFMVRPAQAEGVGVAVVPDGTYSSSVFVALLHQTGDQVRRDSVKVPVLALVAAGGALGLAGIFVLGSSDTPVLGGGIPLSPPGGITIPPPNQYTPPVPPPDGPASQDPALPPTGLLPGPDEYIPTTTTPEPATMALLASGLAGMGGASLVRRRKRD